MLNLDHIDPLSHHLICGLDKEVNVIIVEEVYNKHKKDRFIPYRVQEYPAPRIFGDMAEFLINNEWTVCEFGGSEWRKECRRVGFSSTRNGKNAGEKTQAHLTGIFNPANKHKVEDEWGRKRKPVLITSPDGLSRMFASCAEAANFFGLRKAQISKVCNGHISHTKGYKCRFTD